MKYLGRFAPSPTGPLHAGSLVAALASWLDARAHEGTWLVRIEDVDTMRCKPEFAEQILQQLHACQLISDQVPVYQSKRNHLYQSGLEQLRANKQAYPCSCSRADLSRRLQAQGQALARGQELVYPGYCAQGLCWPNAQQIAWRLRTQGPLHQEVGDFILQRADGCFSYQLAVVVDDALQGITHVVRGADLESNTSRQIYLQTCLQYPRPSYLHTPLVLGSNGEKLSKQNQAQALDTQNALADLQAAAQALGLPVTVGSISESLVFWQKLWKQRRQLYETEIF